jgi:hypothetical protein
MSCIEFIGCTSSGKSTLVNRILQICRADGVYARLGEDFLLDQFHLSRLGSSTARAALVNLVSLPVALVNWRKYRHFYGFSFRTITQLQISQREKFYLGRNILKSIGIYEIASTRSDDRQVIFLDEGPLHSANALFVHVAAAPPDVELSEFVRMVPFPDAAVYLREREDVLIQRTLARGHKRIQNGNRGEVEQFVHSAITVFERLAQVPAIQFRLFIVNDRQVSPPRRDPGDSLQKFVLGIIRACLNEPSVNTGIANQSFTF